MVRQYAADHLALGARRVMAVGQNPPLDGIARDQHGDVLGSQREVRSSRVMSRVTISPARTTTERSPRSPL